MTTQNFTEEQLFSRLREQLESGEISKEQAEQAIYAFRNKVTPEAARQETMPEGNVVSGARETATAAIGGVGGQIASGLAGLGAMIPGGRSPTEAVEATQQWFAEKSAPKTQAGTAGVQKLGDLIEFGVDVAEVPISGLAGIGELIAGQGPEQAAQTVRNVQEKGISQTAGDRAFEETGSPIFATAAYMSPELIASIVPVTRMRQNRSNFQVQMGERIRNAEAMPALSSQLSDVSTAVRSGEGIDALPKALDEIRKNAPARVATKLDDVADDIAAGVSPQGVANKLDDIARDAGRADPDARIVEYVRDGAGRAKADPLATEAIKQGFDEGVVAALKAATPEDRAAMQRMVDIMERGRRNARYAVNNRPSDVAGQSMLARVNHIKQVNSEAGKQLDSVAKSLKGQTVDFDEPVQNFLTRLDDMGVGLGDDLKPIYAGSDIEGVKAAQNVLDNVIQRMRTGATPDAYDLHRMKKYIDEHVTYGKTAEGLAGNTERVLKDLRRDLDNVLDSQFPEYNRVNTTYADTISALDSVQDVAGKKLDLFGPNSDKAVGTLLRRMMSNAQSRVNLMDAVDEVETIARRYGGTFADDVGAQMLFADELDSVFGPVARTGFQRSVGEGVKQGIEMATGQKTGLGMLTEAAGKLADRAKGINQENAFISIKNLLERE